MTKATSRCSIFLISRTLRFDTIGTILTYAKFYPDSKTLIYDETDFILTGAFAERGSGSSNIVSLYKDKFKNRNMCVFNLSEHEKFRVSYVELNNLTDTNNHFFKIFASRYQLYFDK